MYDMYTVTDAAANLLFLNSKWIADERNIKKATVIQWLVEQKGLKPL